MMNIFPSLGLLVKNTNNGGTEELSCYHGREIHPYNDPPVQFIAHYEPFGPMPQSNPALLLKPVEVPLVDFHGKK